MVNLFDIMRGAQHGGFYENLARQFGLSVPDAQRAAEALLPAFSMGLQRTGSDPTALASVLGMMSSGRFAPFYERPFAEFWPQARSSGNDVLSQLFGSPEAIRRIAGQAAATSGIGASVLQQVMPAMAGVLMGGLFKTLTVEGFADFLRQWADWLSAARLSRPPPRSAGPANALAPWIDMMTALFGTGAAVPPAAPAPGRAAPFAKAGPGPSPSGDLWSEMVKAWTDAQRPEPPPPPPPPPPSRPNPFEALSEMFQTGREVQAQHLAGLQSAFDALWGTGRPR